MACTQHSRIFRRTQGRTVSEAGNLWYVGENDRGGAGWQSCCCITPAFTSAGAGHPRRAEKRGLRSGVLPDAGSGLRPAAAQLRFLEASKLTSEEIARFRQTVRKEEEPISWLWPRPSPRIDPKQPAMTHRTGGAFFFCPNGAFFRLISATWGIFELRMTPLPDTFEPMCQSFTESLHKNGKAARNRTSRVGRFVKCAH